MQRRGLQPGILLFLLCFLCILRLLWLTIRGS
jgi:hypothetical protein